MIRTSLHRCPARGTGHYTAREVVLASHTRNDLPRIPGRMARGCTGLVRPGRRQPE